MTDRDRLAQTMLAAGLLNETSTFAEFADFILALIAAARTKALEDAGSLCDNTEWAIVAGGVPADDAIAQAMLGTVSTLRVAIRALKSQHDRS